MKLRHDLEPAQGQLENLLAQEYLKNKDARQEEPSGVIKAWIIIARLLGDGGKFQQANHLFDRARILALQGGNKAFIAEVALYCAELLNKWGAANAKYSVDAMNAACEHASEAAQSYEDILHSQVGVGPMDVKTQEKLATSLYWKGLNYATLCRLGGKGHTTGDVACAIAGESLRICLNLRKACKADPAKLFEVDFARGVLTFCMAEALKAGHLYKDTPNKSLSSKSLYQEALDLFQGVYQDWKGRLGEKSLETVKAITMLGQVSNKILGPQAALVWTQKEVAIREDVQGKLHPRTLQAKRTLENLKKQLAGEGGGDEGAKSDGESGDGPEQGKNTSDEEEKTREKGGSEAEMADEGSEKAEEGGVGVKEEQSGSTDDQAAESTPGAAEPEEGKGADGLQAKDETDGSLAEDNDAKPTPDATGEGADSAGNEQVNSDGDEGGAEASSEADATKADKVIITLPAPCPFAARYLPTA
jgi:hypothetical protein